MRGQFLFANMRAKWPQTVLCVSECGLWNGVFSVYETIERDIDHEGELLKLANWAFAQALSPNDLQKSQNRKWVQSASVPYTEFDIRMKDNLSDPSWAKYRKLYRS